MNSKDYSQLKEAAKAIGGPTGNLIIQLADELRDITTKFTKNIFTTNEACKYLGVGRTNLYRIVKNKQIGWSRPGGAGSAKMFFTREDLDAYVSRNYHPSDADIEEEAANWI